MASSDVQYSHLTNMEDCSAFPVPVFVSSAIQNRVEFCKKLRRLAGMEIVLGILAMVLGIILLALHYTLSTPRHEGYPLLVSGIWCGPFLVVTGILGIKVEKNPSLSMYNANMVLSILASIAMAVILSFSGMGAAAYYLIYQQGYLKPFTTLLVMMVLSSFLAIIGLLGMIVSIVHSAYCCKGVCCVHNGPRAVIGQDGGHPDQPQQMVQLADGRFVLAPTQSSPEYVLEASAEPSVSDRAPSSSSDIDEGRKVISAQDPPSYDEDTNSDTQLLIA